MQSGEYVVAHGERQNQDVSTVESCLATLESKERQFPTVPLEVVVAAIQAMIPLVRELVRKTGIRGELNGPTRSK